MSDDLTFEQKVELTRLFMTLREPNPIGVIGILEFRNLIEKLFPLFGEVRDQELDDMLLRLAQDQSSSQSGSHIPESESA